MTTIDSIYQEMQRIAPLALSNRSGPVQAGHW